MVFALLLPLAAASSSEALYVACRAADRRMDGPSVMAVCSACVDADPWGQRALFCAGRLDQFAQRQDPDGGFSALAALELARRGELSDDALTEAVAPGAATVQVEAALWSAAQLGPPAERAARLSAVEPLTRHVDPAIARHWALRTSTALAASGATERAREVEAAGGLVRAGRRSPVDRVVRAQRLSYLRWAAGAVALLWVAAATALSRGAERPALVAAWPLAVALLGGGLIGVLWDEAAAPALLALAVALPLAHLLSAAALQVRPHAAVRLANVVGTLALSWWLLDRTGGLRWLVP